MNFQPNFNSNIDSKGNNSCLQKNKKSKLYGRSNIQPTSGHSNGSEQISPNFEENFQVIEFLLIFTAVSNTK